jgi:hypothetical protein
MAGTQTFVSTKSGSQLLYLTVPLLREDGSPVFTSTPKSSITGEKIEGPFLYSTFRAQLGTRPTKLRAEPKFADEIVAITGEVSTKAKVEAAFAILKEKHGKPAVKATPKKAKATTSVKRAPKKETMAPMPTLDELNLARYEAAMKIMADLGAQLGVKGA